MPYILFEWILLTQTLQKYAIIIVEASTAGLLEHQHNVVAVGEFKLSIQSNVFAVIEGNMVILFASVLFIINLHEIQDSIITFNPIFQQHF
jgi:hypothetical protein